MRVSSLICCPTGGKTTMPEPWQWGQADAYENRAFFLQKEQVKR